MPDKWGHESSHICTILGESAYLPPEIASMAELSSVNPLVNVQGDEFTALSALNDNGYSFEKIADFN